MPSHSGTFGTRAACYSPRPGDEAPHLTALALLPLVIFLLTLAFRRRRFAHCAVLVVLIVVMTLATDFAPIEIMMAALCLIAVFPRRDFGRNAITVFCIGVPAYIIVSPFLSPSLIHAIRQASAASEGGWTVGSLTGLAVSCARLDRPGMGLQRWTSDWRLYSSLYLPT